MILRSATGVELRTLDRRDYSQLVPNDQIKERDWSLLPSQVDLYFAYGNKLYEMDTGSELPSDDEVIPVVSDDTGVPIDQI